MCTTSTEAFSPEARVQARGMQRWWWDGWISRIVRHNRTQRMALRSLTGAADHVIVNANAIRRQVVEEEGIEASARVSLIPNGIDLERFDAESRAWIEGVPSLRRMGCPIVLHVANMNHEVKRCKRISWMRLL